jgi:hypothetical protein
LALKRTELKRSKLENKRKKDQAKKKSRDIRKIIRLTNLTQYQLACAAVDERDRGRCKGCGETYGLEHHHARYRSAGGKDDKENLVLLCGWCHKYSPTSPHMSKEGREKWIDYLTSLYPEYWANSRKSQYITQQYNNNAIGGR